MQKITIDDIAKVLNLNPRNGYRMAYPYTFKQPSSLTEMLFSPREIVRAGKNNTRERIQRWFIDNNDFQSGAFGKSLDVRDTSSRELKNIIDLTFIQQGLDQSFFLQSFAGHAFSFFATSIILRFIEIFFQTCSYSLYFSALNKKIKFLIEILLTMATLALPFLYLGFDRDEITLCFFLPIVLPIVMDNVLPYKLNNLFKQIITLSSNKDFSLKNFIVKNIQYACFHSSLLIFTLILYWAKPYLAKSSVVDQSPTVTCSIKNGKVHLNHLNDYFDFWNLVSELIGTVLGKITFDLLYIFILKIILKGADLRNPMGSIFSKLRVQNSATETHGKLQENNKLKNQRINREEINNGAITDTSAWTENIQVTPKIIREKKVNTKDKEPSSNTINKKSSKQKIIERISVNINGCKKTFQKLNGGHFVKETWGIIVADRVEKNILTSYENWLFNGQVGSKSVIRQVVGSGSVYELGYNTNSRLIGRMHYGDVFNTLLKFMHYNDALHMSQEFENKSRSNEIGLIVFSHEAKKHEDIYSIARKV